MRLFHRLAVLTLPLLVAGAAHAAPPGFAFLDIPAGARAAAMGGAYASLATGVEAAYWNPARLTTAHRLEVTAGHSELFAKLRHDYFAVGGGMLGGSAAASIRALYSEPIDERDDLGNLVGSFGYHDLELALGYGAPLGAGLSVGGSAALLRERISNSAAQTYSFGAGAAWEPAALPGVRVALAAQNLGPAARFSIDTADGSRTDGAPVGLPAAVQAGVAYALGVGPRMHFAGALEARAVRGGQGLGMAGAELADASGAALRLGVRVNDTSTAMSFGAGYALQKFSFDYAFVPLKDDLGDTHRFGFSARF